MALFDYGFKRLSCPSDPRPVLPSPLGSLNKLVPSTSMVEANKEVSERIVKCKDGKRASYLKVTPEMKAKVANTLPKMELYQNFHNSFLLTH